MHIVGTGKRVRIYVDDGAKWHGKSLMNAILEHLRDEGCAGATVFRGAAGFGAHNRLHTNAIEVLAMNLPVVVEWIDNAERIERVLPSVCAMVDHGLITVESVEIAKYAHREIRALPSLTVGSLMNRAVVTARPTTPVRELVELLINQDYRALPVVTDDGKVVGIVTNGDLVERGGLTLRLELLGALDQRALHEELEALSASELMAEDIMTRAVVTIGEQASLATAVQLMVEKRLKRLPVVDARERLVGIVSRSDILRLLGEGYAQPAGPEPHPTGQTVTVGEVMTRSVPTVSAGASLGEVLDAVVSTRLNRAIVVDADRHPIGVISDADVIRRTQPAHHVSLLNRLMRRFRSGPTGAPGNGANHDFIAAEAMRTPIQTVTSDTLVAAAASTMLTSRRKILPVVDADGRLVGALDRGVLLRAIAGQANAEAAE